MRLCGAPYHSKFRDYGCPVSPLSIVQWALAAMAMPPPLHWRFRHVKKRETSDTVIIVLTLLACRTQGSTTKSRFSQVWIITCKFNEAQLNPKGLSDLGRRRASNTMTAITTWSGGWGRLNCAHHGYSRVHKGNSRRNRSANGPGKVSSFKTQTMTRSTHLICGGL